MWPGLPAYTHPGLVPASGGRRTDGGDSQEARALAAVESVGGHAQKESLHCLRFDTFVET